MSKLEAEKHTLSGRINDARVHAEYDKQRDAARKLIAAEKQEPVAKNEGGSITWLIDNWPQNCLLYTHPQPKREPLTDEQIAEFFGVKAVDESFVDFVRAIEAAHGIKD